MMYHSRHYSPVIFLIEVVSLHCMCFSGTGLTVGHDSSVETIEDVVEDWTSHLIEYFLLGGIHIEDIVVHE